MLKKKYYALNKKAYPARQRLTLPAKEGQKSGEALKDNDTLAKYGLSNGSVVQYKDLGPQVGGCTPTHTQSGPGSPCYQPRQVCRCQLVPATNPAQLQLGPTLALCRAPAFTVAA